MASDYDDAFGKMGKLLDEPAAGLGAFEEEPKEKPGMGEWIGGFLNSAVQSPAELFGMDAGPEAEAFRLQNPVFGFVSELLGTSIPYIGWAKASKSIKAMETLIQGASGVGKAKPFVSGAIEEAVRYAPFEAARNISTAIVNPDKSGETFGESMINLGLGSAVGGLFKVAKAHGVLDQPFGELAGVDHHITVPTVKLQQVRENMAKGLYDNAVPKQSLERAERYAKHWEEQIKKEQLRGTERYVTLGGERKSGSLIMDYFFRPGARKGSETKLLTNALNDRRGLGTNAEAAEIIAETWGKEGLNGVRFPRVRTITGPADVTEKTIQSKMTPVGEDLWMTQDGNDGAYIFAKKISPEPLPGDVEKLSPLTATPEQIKAQAAVSEKIKDLQGKAEGYRVRAERMRRAGDETNAKRWEEEAYLTDTQVADMRKQANLLNPAKKEAAPGRERYVFWQTNDPHKFAGEAAKWNNAVLNSWGSGPKIIGEPGTIWEAADKMEEPYSLRQAFHTAGPTKQRAGIAALMNKQGTPEQLTFRHALGRWLKSIAAPGDFAYTGSPRANMIWKFANDVKEYGDSVVSALTRGAYQATGKKPVGDLLKAIGFTGEYKNQKPIVKIITDNLKTDADRAGFNHVRRYGISVDEAHKLRAEGQITDGAFNALEELHELNVRLLKSMNLTLEKAGLPLIKPTGKHYDLMNQWSGDIRVEIRDGEDHLVHMIGTNTGEEADKIVAAMKADPSIPKDWKFGNKTVRASTPEIYNASKFNVNSTAFSLADRVMKRVRPVSLKRKPGTAGFTADVGVQSNKEIYDEAEKHVRDLVNFTTDTTIRAKMQRHVEDLVAEDPFMANKLSSRYDTMMGRYSGFHQFQNAALDTVLGQAVGSNSADKISRAANSGMHMLQLGMGNVMHPTLTIVGSIQTLLPQIAYIAKAGDAALSKHYVPWAIGDGNGFARGAIGVLSPWKLVWQGIKGMRNASPELRKSFEFCADRGLISPTLDQEFFGTSAALGKSLKSAWENDGLWGAIKYASEYMPRKSEEMTRMMSISTGVEVAKTMLGLTDQAAINSFVSRFLKHTMFSYGAHAKPELFQGALGSTFGLFKNWTMNYMFWLGEYAGLAAKEKQMGPLLWMLGSTATVAGAGGTAVVGLADPFVKAFSGKGVYENIHDQFDPDNDLYADAIYHGLPGFFGLTLQGSAAMPGADPARDASMLYNFVMYDRMKKMGEFIGDGWDTWTSTGKHPMASGQVRDALAQALAPRSIMRAMQIQSDGYIHSLNTNQPIVQVSPIEGMMHVLGFNSVKASDAYEMASILFRDKQLRRRALAVYANKWMDAQENGSQKDLDEVYRMTVALGIPFNQLMRSVHGRRSRAAQDLVSSRLPKSERGRFEAARGLGEEEEPEAP
jgi:hypothetical protein